MADKDWKKLRSLASEMLRCMGKDEDEEQGEPRETKEREASEESPKGKDAAISLMASTLASKLSK